MLSISFLETWKHEASRLDFIYFAASLHVTRAGAASCDLRSDLMALCTAYDMAHIFRPSYDR